MKTEAEIIQAATAFALYIASGGLGRLDKESRDNIIGVVACLEWMQGDDDPAKNPVAGMLFEIRRRENN